MKCYFLLVFLYSVICDGIPMEEYQKKCESTVPTKIQDCSNSVDPQSYRCCYFEGKKDGNPIKKCKMYDYEYYENTDNIKQDAIASLKWEEISFVKCDPSSKTDSRSDSKYLKLGILSLLFLI